MNVDWNAIGAVSTAAATAVALILGILSTREANKNAKKTRAERMLNLALRLYIASEHWELSATRPAERTFWMSEINGLATTLEAYGWERPDNDSLDYRESLRELMNTLASQT
jgi:hypothetical protein